ncbi:hypothetical protein BS47DRAFT_1338832 [Hydnum rufescens UP504]|uniref:Transcriptional regulator of RNA polII, SAGA, subunit-domain-containing protein n=1 Tax=Hydnum rufescens UP504 TaxID=1448309 RepID=A0A9P6B615_9AGAM|nr:hypothetical protein BS47DRAFT_1338832 [Hydnum rufescens UP504]
MESASTIKAQLGAALGSNGLPYWRSLSDFLSGKVSRSEFERIVRKWIDTPELVKLHNSLIMSMMVVSRRDPAFDPNAGSNLPARKRRKLMPHQDPPPRLRRWIVGIRKQERERLRALAPTGGSGPAPSWYDDEISLERAIMLRPEGKNPPGTRVPIQLSSTSRTLPSHQNLTERISLIASQHNLTTSRPVAALATAAIEAFLKQLAMHALTLTSSSHPFTSISPASGQNTSTLPSSLIASHSQSTLTLSSLLSLLTVVPASLPTSSAAMDKLFLRGPDLDASDGRRSESELAMESGLDEGLAQYWALLSARSGVRDFIAG